MFILWEVSFILHLITSHEMHKEINIMAPEFKHTPSFIYVPYSVCQKSYILIYMKLI